MPDTEAIKNWVATSHPGSPSDSENDSSDLLVGSVHLPPASSDNAGPLTWKTVLEQARPNLYTSKKSLRIPYLRDCVLPLARKKDQVQASRSEVFKLLLGTISRYEDTDSIEAVLQVVTALLKAEENPKLLDGLATWVLAEAEKLCLTPHGTSTSASGSRLALLRWSCALFDISGGQVAEGKSPSSWNSVVGSMALLLDTLQDTTCTRRVHIRKGSLSLVRRVLRNNHKVIPTLIETLTVAGSSFRNAVLLGTVVSVSLRMRAGKEPVKGTTDGIGHAYVKAAQRTIVSFWITTILSARTSPPSRSTAYLSEVLAKIDDDEILQDVMPVAEKMALRSPEVSLAVLSDFFEARPYKIPTSARDTLTNTVISSSKSSNINTRQGARQLFSTLCKIESPESLDQVIDEVLAPLKTGKASGPEHRATLADMLASLPYSRSSSSAVVATCSTLLLKEVNESAIQNIATAMRVHLCYVLGDSAAFSNADHLLATKPMQDSRPATRRAACNAVGLAISDAYEHAHSVTPTLSALAVQLVKTFEVNLKNAATNPLTATAGPLEGYVAVAIAYGPLSNVKEVETFRKSNPFLAGVASSGAKGSFVFVDKVYKKAVSAAEDGFWLVKALEAIWGTLKSQLEANDTFRASFAQTIVYLAVFCPVYESRRAALASVDSLNVLDRALVTTTVLAGVRGSLMSIPQAPPVNNREDGSELKSQRSGRFKSLIHTLFKYEASTEKDEDRPESALIVALIMSSIVICHHSLIDPTSAFWVGLIHSARANPPAALTLHASDVLTVVSQEMSVDSFRDAAYSAAGTVALIIPKIAVPRLVEETLAALDPASLEFIGAEEFGIWVTPEGTCFVDVTSSGKDSQQVTKNVKQRAIEDWENEVRESIEKKKAGGTKALTSQQQALVKTQLIKESQTRDRVRAQLGMLRHGFALFTTLIKSRTEEVERRAADLVVRLSSVLSMTATSLIAQEGFDAFTSVLSLCTERIRQLGLSLILALLRGNDAKVVPTELQQEDLSVLLTRILYKVRALAEQSMVDAISFVYIAPLLSLVIRKRGVGLGPKQIDEKMEQVAIAVDILHFSGATAASIPSLRTSLIEDCLLVVSSLPQLIKQATMALIAVGTAIADDTQTSDIQALMRGLLSHEAQARYAALQALQPLDLTEIGWSAELWVTRFDKDERNASLAQDVWAENGLDVPNFCLSSLMALLEHGSLAVHSSAASALAAAAQAHRELVSAAVAAIVTRYTDLAKELVPEYDQFGMIIQESLDREDPWRQRAAQAQALAGLASQLHEQDIQPIFDLLITKQSLGDRHESVRIGMLAAGSAVVDLHGAAHLEHLIELFQAVLAKGSSGSEGADYVAESTVILFGRLARHLNASDPRLDQVISRLVDTLKTPSEVVQSAVSDCLPPLVRLRRNESSKLVESLLHQTLSAASYAERRGSAYGLAGAVKGCGLSILRTYSIISRLKDALESKKNSQARQGSVFAIEILATSLGRLFEPYLLQMTSMILIAFGDSASEVRTATQDASAAIMRGLSATAVKSILPTLLEGLDEKQWRAKKGAIDLMGSMAYLAPKQLSSALPTIIPRLTDVLTDTHTQVRTAANASLKRFGEVVTNPEISGMQDILLAALVDPARKTPKALDILLGTAFVHVIDTSALALIIPIIERGLRERSAETKRKATQIVGNLATLTEAKDFVPYLPQLMSKVHMVLVDPVPEARATAAKALGGLVERLGEESFPDLVPSLFDILRADASGVDQQGAAQGLSEILSGLGTNKLDQLLPDIIANTSSPRAYVREGFISLLVFLPATYGDRFSPYLGRIIQPVLRGLADDSEYVREASMRAGKMIIVNHSGKAIDLLLPALERGLFDDSWRTRQSSIQLLGELLFKIAGITGKNEVEEEEDDMDMPSMEASRKALTDTLGKERRDRVLAAIYIVRQDASGLVRSACLHVWKVLVHNTPRTVREIMPTLMQILVRIMASEGDEQRETAARTLGELVKKLGDNVMGIIISILQKAGTSDDTRTREGACLAVVDVLESSSKNQLEDHESAISAIVRTGLVDQQPSVRAAAAQAFDSLQHQLGPRASEEMLPTLLSALQGSGETSEAALDALKELMRFRASTILPRLVPVLTQVPISAFNARALSILVSVSGSAIDRHLNTITEALRQSWKDEANDDDKEKIHSSLELVFSSVAHEEGVHSLMMHLISRSKSELPAVRSEACDVFTVFVRNAVADMTDYYVLWVRQLVSMFEDPASAVVKSAWTAMDEMVRRIPKENMEPLVVPLRRTIESVGMAGSNLPGFSQSGGLKPILPILLQGMLAGTSEQREQAAYGMGDLVERTSQDAIKPFVTQIAGPLIRVIGDRHPPPVKSAILHSLRVLLQCVPQLVKPFYPQLQRTFLKSVSDPTSLVVRSRAIAGLEILMLHQPRIDPLVNELLTGATGEDGDIQESLILALAASMSYGSKNVGDAAMTSITGFIEGVLSEPQRESCHVAIAKLIAGLAKMRASAVKEIIRSSVVGGDPSQFASLCLRELVEQTPDAIYELGILDAVITKVLASSVTGQPPSISRPARDVKQLLKTSHVFAYDESVQSRLT